LPNAIKFNSLSLDNVEAKTQIEISTQLTESFEISFHSKYMLDFIAQSNQFEFMIEFNESSLPFVLRDNNFITIIMPIIA